MSAKLKSNSGGSIFYMYRDGTTREPFTAQHTHSVSCGLQLHIETVCDNGRTYAKFTRLSGGVLTRHNGPKGVRFLLVDVDNVGYDQVSGSDIFISPKVLVGCILFFLVTTEWK